MKKTKLKKVKSKFLKHGELWIDPAYSFKGSSSGFSITKKKTRHKKKRRK